MVEAEQAVQKSRWWKVERERKKRKSKGFIYERRQGTSLDCESLETMGPKGCVLGGECQDGEEVS
jgi:hypothetical protein